MTKDHVRALLRRECEQAGSQAAWARANGVSPAYVAGVLLNIMEPGQKILTALGVKRVVTYRQVKL